jgi:FlaG/FlaF family flagellin (archaellin)
LASTEGRLCACLYRRADDTVLTTDCPVGLRALRRRVSGTAAAVFALIGTIGTVAFGQGRKKESCPPQTRITQKELVPRSAETILTGHVMDANGAMIPEAKVTLRNANTKEIQIATSDEEGRFQFSAIPPGKYSVTIERSYFSKHSIKDIQIRNNQATNVDVNLHVDKNSELIGVIVTGDEIDAPGTTTINQKLLRSLPH